jgi:uncharacterized protein (DUF302 family)
MNGLTTIQSEFRPKETMDRLEAEIGALEMKVFARINYAALATEIDRKLQATEILIFDDSSAGILLMRANQSMA